MNIIEAEAARAAGWAGQHFRLPRHRDNHDQDQLPGQDQLPAQETRMSIADAKRAMEQLAANKLVIQLDDAGLGTLLTPSEIGNVMAIVSAIESPRRRVAAETGAMIAGTIAAANTAGAQPPAATFTPNAPLGRGQHQQ